MSQREEVESYRCYSEEQQRRDWEKVESHYTNCATVLAVIAYLFTLFPFESGLVLNWSLLPRFALLNKRKAPLSVCERLVIVFAAPRVWCGRLLPSISPGQTGLEAERGAEWPSRGGQETGRLWAAWFRAHTQIHSDKYRPVHTQSLSSTSTKCLSLACPQTEAGPSGGLATRRGRHALIHELAY